MTPKSSPSAKSVLATARVGVPLPTKVSKERALKEGRSTSSSVEQLDSKAIRLRVINNCFFIILISSFNLVVLQSSSGGYRPFFTACPNNGQFKARAYFRPTPYHYSSIPRLDCHIVIIELDSLLFQCLRHTDTQLIMINLIDFPRLCSSCIDKHADFLGRSTSLFQRRIRQGYGKSDIAHGF